MRRLLVDDCAKLSLSRLRRNGPRGKLRLRGLSLEYEIMAEGVANPRRHVRLKFPDGRAQSIRIVEMTMPNTFGHHLPTRWFFDLGGGRRAYALFLAPGDTIFRSRRALGAKYLSNQVRPGTFKKVARERYLREYPLDIQIGIRPPNVTRSEWKKMKRLFGQHT
jgi:hypothetical protein